MNQNTKPLIVKKSVRHDFTADETRELHTQFRQAYAALKATEAEFDNVKGLWKAKTTESEARMETLNMTLQAGFEMRQKECIVIFRPVAKKKDFYIADGFTVSNVTGEPSDDNIPILTEDMTQADFEQDLIQAEAMFENRVELELWAAGPDAGGGQDCGRLIVGKHGGKWYSAIRGNVGAVKIEERLDSEQRAFKKRPDAVGEGAKRAMKWLKANFKDDSKGFEDKIAKLVEAEQDKAE